MEVRSIKKKYIKKHNCKNGFYGTYVKAKGLKYCGFCGYEANKKLNIQFEWQWF